MATNHEWWAVELRKWLDAGDRDLAAAIEHVLELVDAEPDCEECLDEWAEYDLLPSEQLDDVLDAARTDGAYAAIDELRTMVLRRGV